MEDLTLVFPIPEGVVKDKSDRTRAICATRKIIANKNVGNAEKAMLGAIVISNAKGLIPRFPFIATETGLDQSLVNRRIGAMRDRFRKIGIDFIEIILVPNPEEGRQKGYLVRATKDIKQPSHVSIRDILSSIRAEVKRVATDIETEKRTSEQGVIKRIEIPVELILSEEEIGLLANEMDKVMVEKNGTSSGKISLLHKKILLTMFGEMQKGGILTMEGIIDRLTQDGVDISNINIRRNMKKFFEYLKMCGNIKISVQGVPPSINKRVEAYLLRYKYKKETVDKSAKHERIEYDDEDVLLIQQVLTFALERISQGTIYSSIIRALLKSIKTRKTINAETCSQYLKEEGCDVSIEQIEYALRNNRIRLLQEMGVRILRDKGEYWPIIDATDDDVAEVSTKLDAYYKPPTPQKADELRKRVAEGFKHIPCLSPERRRVFEILLEKSCKGLTMSYNEITKELAKEGIQVSNNTVRTWILIVNKINEKAPKVMGYSLEIEDSVQRFTKLRLQLTRDHKSQTDSIGRNLIPDRCDIEPTLNIEKFRKNLGKAKVKFKHSYDETCAKLVLVLAEANAKGESLSAKKIMELAGCEKLPKERMSTYLRSFLLEYMPEYRIKRYSNYTYEIEDNFVESDDMNDPFEEITGGFSARSNEPSFGVYRETLTELQREVMEATQLIEAKRARELEILKTHQKNSGYY